MSDIGSELANPETDKEMNLRMFRVGNEFLASARKLGDDYYFELPQFEAINPKICVVQAEEFRIQIKHWDFPTTPKFDGKTLAFHLRPNPLDNPKNYQGEELDIPVLSYSLTVDEGRDIVQGSGMDRMERINLKTGEKINLPGATSYMDWAGRQAFETRPDLAAFANLFLGITDVGKLDPDAKRKVLKIISESKPTAISRYDIGYDDTPSNCTFPVFSK